MPTLATLIFMLGLRHGLDPDHLATIDWDYALNRGGKLAVNFDQGQFMFCFQPVGEFE